MNKEFLNFQIEAEEELAKLYIYGDIKSYEWWTSSSTADEVKNQIKDFKGRTIEVHVNSCGGDVFTGICIYNLLKEHSAEVIVYVDSIAASIASVICLAADKVLMPKNTLMMIHNCFTYAVGNAEEIRKTADDIEKVNEMIIESYLGKVKISRDKLKELMDNESYLTPNECLEYGFCDEVLNLNVKSYEQNMLNSLVSKINNSKKQDEIEKNILNKNQKKAENLFESFFNEIYKDRKKEGKIYE